MSKAENLNVKGVMAIRAARACALSKGHCADAIEMTRKNDPQVSAFLEKSMVSGQTTEGMPSLAGDAIARELGGYIFSQSVPGKLLATAMQFPFGSPLATVGGIGAGWVKEGESVPVRTGETTNKKLKPYKIASLIVLSDEAVRLADTGANLAIRNTLTSEAVRKIDEKFMSIDSEQDDLSPAGALAGAEKATGFADLLEKHTANGNSLATSALILPTTTVLTLTDAQFKQFELLGIQLISSQSARQIALIDAANMLINVQGTLIDVATDGALEMEDAPDNNITDPEASNMVSLYQTNSVAFRGVTYCSWAAAGKAVTVIEGTS